MAGRGGGSGRGGFPRYFAELARLLGVTTARLRRLAGEFVEALRLGGLRLYLVIGMWRLRRARAARRRASG